MRIDEFTAQHLGAEATEELAATFRQAAREYRASTGCDDEEAMNYVWNDGDFLPVLAEMGYSRTQR